MSVSVFEVVNSPVGDSLVLDGVRISGSNPFGFGRTTHRFVTDEKYVVDNGDADRVKEMEKLIRDMARALDVYGDWCSYDCEATFRCERGPNCVCHVQKRMRELGIPLDCDEKPSQQDM